MEFGERVKSLTQDWLLPKVTDNVLNGNIMGLRLIGNASQGKGESIKKPIKYQTSGSASSFAGLDSFTATPLNTKVRMQYNMRGVRIPVAVSGMDAVANAVSETQITDLIQNSLEESEDELLDVVGDMMYSTGTGNNNKDFIGLNAIVDDGTDVSTIGTLSRTTYPVLNATRTAFASNTISLLKLSTLFSAVSGGSTRQSPTLMTSNETVWDLYESLLTGTVQNTYSEMGYYRVGMQGGPMRPQQGLVAHGGFVAVTFKGIAWVRDEKATAQTVYMLNENYLDFYGWDAKGIFGYNKVSLTNNTVDGLYSEPPMSSYNGFNWSGFRAPTNQFAGIADIIILGNLTSWQPRRHGRGTGITGT